MGERNDEIKPICLVKFESLEEDIKELKNNHDKSFDWIQDIKEAIVKLTTIQENQQKMIDATQVALKNNTETQNEILEKILEFQKVLVESSKNKEQMSTKKLMAIVGVISTLITVIGNIIIEILK